MCRYCAGDTGNYVHLCVFPQASALPVTWRLLKDGCLTSYNQECAGRNRRYYRLTALGDEQLSRYQIEWRDYRDRVQNVLFGGLENE